MEFISLSGYPTRVKKASNSLIDWDGKSLSKFQKEVKDFLKIYWEYDMVFEEFPMAGSRLRFDFYNASQRMVVEAHGRQHLEFNKFFHKTRQNWLKQFKRDENKRKFCERNDITFIEIHDKKELTEEFFKEKYGIELT